MQILPSDKMQRIGERLERLYGESRRERLLRRISLLAGRYGVGICRDASCGERPWSERDTLLITYGDMVRRDDEPPLLTLRRFLDAHVRDGFSGVHILPFFPYSSDDGFSVIDFRRVDPALGDWQEIQAISEDFKLMADLVLNHVSSKSEWFRNYTNCLGPERDYFIETDPDADLGAVVRPRSLPLLTSAQTPGGERFVWTTFSADQVDLNYANPDVLFEMLDILLLYVHNGVRMIRLDAVAYLWKALGTPCIHLPQTHEVVKLMRDLLDMLAPGVVLITETNVPHEENVSYFGDGDEAHLVYQFSLPPLLLHALHTGQSAYLREWAAQLQPPPPGCSYFNFTASHDGIGVRPLEGLLPQRQLDALVEGMRQRGGQVSTRRREDGSDTPYELNISYFEALSDPGQSDDTLQVARFLCSQAVMLGLQGIPGIYFNSLLGAGNDYAATQQSGMARSLNRHKWLETQLHQQLDDQSTTTYRVFHAFLHLLRIRRAQPAFHPDARQQVLDLPEGLFGFVRTAEAAGQRLVAISNLTEREQRLDLRTAATEISGRHWSELISGEAVSGEALDGWRMAPYQTLWLSHAKEA